MRLGYSSEYRCKKENEEIYGEGNVIKVAIGGSSDFMIINFGKMIKIIEVKETTKNKYYPKPREKEQFNKLIELGKQHSVHVELWVYFKKGSGKPLIKHKNFLC